MKNMIFSHGAFSETYEKQANVYGYTLGKEANRIQDLGECAITLRINKVLTEKQYNAVLNKIQKEIDKNLIPLTKEV